MAKGKHVFRRRSREYQDWNPGTGLETQEGTGIISQALGNRFKSGTQHWNRMVDAQELVNTRLNCMDPQSQTTPEYYTLILADRPRSDNLKMCPIQKYRENNTTYIKQSKYVP
ncbi:hypothetical protein TNCV_2277311 [Trichonephila clavipes]|nr:hypothetical protein TNCV_2277311 [Trichonephila clavipes]